MLSYFSAIPQVQTLAIFGCILIFLLHTVVRKAYRTPLKGIPYNQDAAKRWMGDLAELGEREKKGKGMRPWFLEQAFRHNSAVTQIFLGPFAKPAVLVSDFREVNDILSHRDAVDFKRGKKVDVFRGILPHAHAAMETFDPNFKSNRDLLRDLMTPSLLQSINAPHTYQVACNLVNLWRLKSKIAQGHPFEAFSNIIEFSFDAILSAAIGLGPEGGDLKYQFDHLSALENTDSCKVSAKLGRDELVDIPAAKMSVKLAALLCEEESLWKGFYQPWPKLYHFVNKLQPSVRAASRTMRSFLESRIRTNGPKLRAGGQPESALDYVIQREFKAAEKAGREPNLGDARIRDEIYGYLIAGHDTSGGTMVWLMRTLMAHPEEQVKIRNSLHLTYQAAWAEKRLPTIAELSKNDHYLSAFIEEVLRFSAPVVTVVVMTRMDTFILGHPVPGDTQVFLNLAGPSLNMRSVPIEEHVRSSTSQKHRPTKASWDDLDPTTFRPERWLKNDEQGNMIFDPSSGPTLAFSAGNRGCFGKRLAYLELRVVLTLLIWSFEFELPPHLVSWKTYDSLVTAPEQCIMRVKDILSDK